LPATTAKKEPIRSRGRRDGWCAVRAFYGPDVGGLSRASHRGGASLQRRPGSACSRVLTTFPGQGAGAGGKRLFSDACGRRSGASWWALDGAKNAELL